MFDILIYLDEILVKNLNSIDLNGYIDIRTYKSISDKTETGSLSLGLRNYKGEDESFSKDISEGYKSNHKVFDNHCQNSIDGRRGSEDRYFNRIEEEIKRISTNFSLHEDLMNKLYEKDFIRIISNEEIQNGTVSIGEYALIKGILSPISIPMYLDTLINIFECYELDYLDTLIPNDKKMNLKYKTIYKLLKNIKNCITLNSTQDVIFTLGNTIVVLVINENNFSDKKNHIFDLVECNCKIFGKVMRICNDTEDKGLSLLRKSYQENYYEELLESFEEYFNILRANNILIPKKPETNIKGNVVVVLPISISI